MSKLPKRWARASKRMRIYARDGFKCVTCGKAYFRDINELSLDHIVAFSKGGGNEDHNLVTMCRGCNNLKGTKTLHEFLRDMYKDHNVNKRMLANMVISVLERANSKTSHELGRALSECYHSGRLIEMKDFDVLKRVTSKVEGDLDFANRYVMLAEFTRLASSQGWNKRDVRIVVQAAMQGTSLHCYRTLKRFYRESNWDSLEKLWERF